MGITCESSQLTSTDNCTLLFMQALKVRHMFAVMLRFVYVLFMYAICLLHTLFHDCKHFRQPTSRLCYVTLELFTAANSSSQIIVRGT